MATGEQRLGAGQQVKPLPKGARPVRIKVVRTRQGAGGTAMPAKRVDSFGVPQAPRAPRTVNPNGHIRIGGKRYRTDSFGVPQHTPGSGIAHFVRSLPHAASTMLGVPELKDAATNLIHGHDPRLTAPQAQRDMPSTFAADKAFLKSLSPQSIIDIAHGRAPTASHLGQDALFFLPWSRSARALGEGLKAASAAEEGARAAEAAAAAKESYQAGQGVVAPTLKAGGRGAKYVGQRVFKVGGLEAKQAGADSRFGRAIENTLDRHRHALSKVGLMNSVEEKAGRRSAAEIKARADVGTSPGDALLTIVRRPKWNRAKDYALRILSEHSLPGNTLSIADRRAFHLGRAEEMKAAGDGVGASYHRIHARLIKSASRFLTEGADGAIVLKQDAPRDVKEAWRLLQKTAQGREAVYKDIGRLTDTQIAQRIQAPARVFQGARWTPDEKIVQQVLADNPQRAQLFHVIDQLGLEPQVAAASKQMLDAAARHAADLAAAEGHGDPVRAVDELYNQLLESNLHAPEGDNYLAQLAQFHAYPEEQTAKNLAAKARGFAKGAGMHENPRIMSVKGHPVVGPITPEEWVARIKDVIPNAEERAHWANWYHNFEPVFRSVFGDSADELMRAFAVSQANDSPAGGLQASLRIFSDIARGIPVSDHAYSVVGGNIRDAMMGLPVSKGVAAKLSDFIDALREVDTRTWMGHHPMGGAPAPSDVHAARDFGFVDPKILNKLEKEHGIDTSRLAVDNPAGSPAGNRYERVSEWYHQLTQHLNEIGFDGRKDWTPAEVQALGWAGIQKFHGVVPEDFPEALARNTRTIVSPTASGGELAQLVHDNHGFSRSHGPGWIEAVISPEDAGRVAQHLADQHGETRVMWLSNRNKARTPLLRVQGEIPAQARHELVAAGFTHVYETGGETMLRADGAVKKAELSRIIEQHKLDVTFNGKVQEDVRYGEGSTGSRAMAEGRGVGEGEGRLLRSQRGRELAGLPADVKVAGREDRLAFGPSAPLQKLADGYMREAKLPYHAPAEYAKVDAERASRIAAEYDRMAHAPRDPRVKASYDAFIKETMAQYDYLIRHGYRFDFYPPHDPYPRGPREAILDLHRNKHMYVFPTDAGFGHGNEFADHPLLQLATGVKWGGKDVTFNDIFRAVHDVFGHGKEGVGFRADGEENAWRSHAAMYSPEARPAMTAETRGQNSWVNYGPHGEANRTASQADTVYADQKAGIMPDWVQTEGSGQPGDSTLFQRSYTGPFGDENRGPLKGAYTEPPASAGEVAIRAAQKRGVVIKGAHEATSAGAIIHLVQGKADVSTVIHEWGHFLRNNVLDGHAEDVAAKWAGATFDKQAGKWVWDTNAEEKFARGLEQWARTGNGPAPLKNAWRTAGNALREIYDHTDLPDVSPDMNRIFDRLFEYNAQKGGRLLGAEDFHYGVNYVPYTRGAPVALSREAKTWGALIRHRLQLFNPGAKSAIGAGPDDVTLRKAFSGALIRSGNFKADVSRASLRSLHTAWRLASAKMARDVLLHAAEDLPKDPTWLAIKVDPTKNLGPEVKAYWDRIHSVGTDTMSAHDLGELDHVDEAHIDEFVRELFPGEVNGQRTEELAQQLSAAAGHEMAALHEPIDNIKWIPKELLDATGLTQIPSASNLALRGLTKQQRIASKATGMLFDTFNDVQRAGLLILSPSYIPVNLIGNVAMNVLHQGPLAFPNLIRSVFLHRELQLEDRVAIDKLMGKGVMESVLTLKTHPGEILNHTIGHWSGIVVDLAPRRAAFLHEARKAGYQTADELRALLHNEANTQDLVRVRDKATEAIVDYERLSPFERNVVSRAIFVYPWIKGATHYSIRFAANHPVQTMALALMADNAVDNANSELGPRPFYAQMEIPVSTKSLGFEVPGTNLGVNASELVGTHELTGNGHPYTINPRQLITQTTPYELGASIAGTAGLDTANLQSLAGNFNPGLTTLAMFITGHDPNTHKDLPQNLGGLWTAVKENFAALNKVKSIQEADPSNARKLFPRSRNEAIGSLFMSGLLPKPYNTAKGQALTTAGAAAASPVEKAQQWVTSTEKAIGQKLPPEVIQARHTKAVYENLEKEYAKRTATGKLSEIQHTRILLHVLVEAKPEFNQYHQELWNAISTDPSKVRTWLEDKLGWSYITKIDEAVNKLKKQKALEAKSHG